MRMPWEVLVYKSKGKKMKDWELQMIKEMYQQVVTKRLIKQEEVCNELILIDIIDAVGWLAVEIESSSCEGSLIDTKDYYRHIIDGETVVKPKSVE